MVQSKMFGASAAVLAGAALVNAAPLVERQSLDLNITLGFNVTLGSGSRNETFLNLGQVGYGSFPADRLDFLGDTIGGVGSGIAIRPGTFRRNLDGSYSGTFTTQPDRGHNGAGAATVTYPARQLYFDFVLKPYTGNATNGGNNSITLTYRGGLAYIDPNAPGGANYTTGFDPVGIRPAGNGFPQLPIGPNGRVSIDAEGIAYAPDRSFWVSDEYGPNIYHISATGRLLSAITAPNAIAPLNSTGGLNYTATAAPTTGRINNQGYEGLTITPDGTRIYVGLQSGTVEDGGRPSNQGPYTRLLGYNIVNPSQPRLVEEYVLALPLQANGNGFPQSEIAYVKDGVFLVLARDGRGAGNGVSARDVTSLYKNIGIVDVRNATNIANTAFDNATSPVSPNRVLNSAIVPANFTNFISLIDPTQLAKFGLHNGLPLENNIDGKFESLALASVLDPRTPNDYFLFTFSDNDFLTLNGTSAGIPYSDNTGGINVPTQVFAYRVTLPGARVSPGIYGLGI